MAKMFASEVAVRGAARRDAHPRRLRLLDRSSRSSGSTATRPLMIIGEGTNDVLRIVIAKALISGKETVG